MKNDVIPDVLHEVVDEQVHQGVLDMLIAVAIKVKKNSWRLTKNNPF